METIKQIYTFMVSEHGTKTLGFLQITIGAMATGDVFPVWLVKWLIMITGLLTAWRGFFASSQIKKDPSSEV